ncbi:MAG: CRTAC1 family protein [Acidobacteriota bacterium]|nr:CRTAC1 family protein [Acidobacteriota bacterium]
MKNTSKSAGRAAVLACASALLLCVTLPAEQSKTASDGTVKMAELLRKIHAEQDWRTDPNKDAERAKYLKEELAAKPDIRTELKLRKALAESLLKAGDSGGAVKQLEMIRTECKAQGIILTPVFEHDVSESLAIAYLRLGEQENCVMNHGQSSCIVPIRLAGVHKLTRGSEGAIRELTALLEATPEDKESRWLLNLAYMTLGKYPDEVPSRWLIPPATFDSEADIGRFKEVATDAGLSVSGHSGGAVAEDFDGDGLLDLMVSSSGPADQLRFFHNNGDGTFSDRTMSAELTGETGGLNLIVADFDNDGHPDVLVLRGGWWGGHGKYPKSLLRNRGDGTFEDVTEKAGLMSLHPTQTAAWADFDNDGWLDLFVGHESNSTESHPSQLFHNNHDGTFTDVGVANGLADLGFVKGVAWGDFNNDGRPDLYVSRKGAPNFLFRNDGPKDAKNPQANQWKFTELASQAGVTEPVQSFATWFFDYDNDGWPDLYVSGFFVETLQDVGAFEMGMAHKAETPRLFHNNHDGTFTDVTKQGKLDRAILVMGANFGDLDNDGWLDVYLGTGDVPYAALLRNRMFRNDKGKGFQDVTTSGGFGHLQKGHGIAFADFRNSGIEDVFQKMGGAFSGDSYASVLYENPGHGNHWIAVDLEGKKTNRSAFGAKIAVTVGEDNRSRTIYRTVGYGSSFGGNPLRQHIGVGSATRIESVEVTWPTSKLVQKFRDVAVDSFYHLAEGDARLARVERKAFQYRHLPEAPPHQH